MSNLSTYEKSDRESQIQVDAKEEEDKIIENAKHHCGTEYGEKYHGKRNPE